MISPPLSFSNCEKRRLKSVLLVAIVPPVLSMTPPVAPKVVVSIRNAGRPATLSSAVASRSVSRAGSMNDVPWRIPIEYLLASSPYQDP